MCGLFGFYAPGDGRPDLRTLQRVGLEAARRGPHAFGFAWAASPFRLYTQAGCLADYLAALEAAQGRWVIGQTRLATSGTWRDTTSNQPLARETTLVAHNGIVYNAAAIFSRYDYHPATVNDSEALIPLLWAGGPERILREVDARSPLAALIVQDGRLYALRRGHPLYVLARPTGFYFCSRPLGADAALLPDGVTTYAD